MSLLAKLRACSGSATNPKRDVPGFVVREGVAFRSADLLQEEQAIVNAALGAHEPQGCFRNCSLAINRDRSGRLVYVEGYVASGPIGPTHHAWLAIGDKVVDPTLDPASTDEYFGVRIAREYVVKTIRERTTAAVRAPGSGVTYTLLDDWQEGRPIVAGTAQGWRYLASP